MHKCYSLQYRKRRFGTERKRETQSVFMDCDLVNSLIEDINNWTFFDNHIVNCYGDHCPFDDQLAANKKYQHIITANNELHIYFCSNKALGQFLCLEIIIDNYKIKKISFRPTYNCANNIILDIFENAILQRDWKLDSLDFIDIFDVHDLYLNFHKSIDRSLFNKWSINDYFLRIPPLESLQYILDKIINGKNEEIVINI